MDKMLPTGDLAIKKEATSEELYMDRMREKAQAIYEADMYGSYMEGFADGKALGLAKSRAKGLADSKAIGLTEGEANVAIVIARKMLQANAPVETIINITELTRDEVERLRNEVVH